MTGHTRGHSFKLIKQHCTKDIRKNFQIHLEGIWAIPPPPTPEEQSLKLSCDERIEGTDSELSQDQPSPPRSTAAPGTVEPDSSPDAKRAPPGLSEFQSNCKRCWTLPEFNPDEHTLLLAASNGVTLAKSAPRGWRVAAYRGARFVDIHRVLSSAALPEHIKTVVISVGLNDRFGNVNAIREHVHRPTPTVTGCLSSPYSTSPLTR